MSSVTVGLMTLWSALRRIHAASLVTAHWRKVPCAGGLWSVWRGCDYKMEGRDREGKRERGREEETLGRRRRRERGRERLHVRYSFPPQPWGQSMLYYGLWILRYRHSLPQRRPGRWRLPECKLLQISLHCLGSMNPLYCVCIGTRRALGTFPASILPLHVLAMSSPSPMKAASSKESRAIYSCLYHSQAFTPSPMPHSHVEPHLLIQTVWCSQVLLKLGPSESVNDLRLLDNQPWMQYCLVACSQTLL